MPRRFAMLACFTPAAEHTISIQVCLTLSYHCFSFISSISTAAKSSRSRQWRPSKFPRPFLPPPRTPSSCAKHSKVLNLLFLDLSYRPSNASPPRFPHRELNLIYDPCRLGHERAPNHFDLGAPLGRPAPCHSNLLRAGLRRGSTQVA